MNNKDNTKELFDISREPSTSSSNIDIVKYIIRQINNIDSYNINSLFVDYIFITGDESVANEIEQYIDELYSKKSVIFNIPIVRYDKNCPSDTIYWFREGLNTAMKNLDNFFGSMRDATKEEQEKVNSYIDSISEDTGLNFYDILEENDELNRIADEYNKIPEEYLIPYDKLIKIMESTEDE